MLTVQVFINKEQIDKLFCLNRGLISKECPVCKFHPE